MNPESVLFGDLENAGYKLAHLEDNPVFIVVNVMS